ncbi:MAG TPA: glycoside hydrolase family 19 protein [Rhodopila sp.]|uniref:glycoside hydrolase family 19 protein n=1 Tax=Rhodopila sp. TaxID=2480087 RepID=UPI002D1379FE|nr:glycoside hydrolase family 19 protein [Rhodopila sp.]HVY14870.1 glycoside hydrolase family 19 protein [Rhodopila sp.]
MSAPTDLFAEPSLSPAAAAATLVLTTSRPSLSDRLVRGLRAVAPRLSDADRAAWAQALATPLGQAAVTTPNRIAAFLGQCSVESDGFRVLEENLSYSAARLCAVWPSRFPSEAAAQSCAMEPERLANTVYADRLGNGDSASGDGWRFRGRGLIQITGRETYTKFAAAMHLALDAAVEHAATRQGAADSAAWFWSSRRLNALADAWMLEKMTITINGGSQGAAERARLCEAARHAIGA